MSEQSNATGQPTYTEMDEARTEWWSGISKRGDPAKLTSSLGGFGDGFFAGFKAASARSAIPSTSISVPISLAKWAASTLEGSREHGGSDLDGGYLFDLGESLGVIKPVKVTEPCDPTACNCAEYGDFPQDCYRLAPEVSEALERIEAIK